MNITKTRLTPLAAEEHSSLTVDTMRTNGPGSVLVVIWEVA